MPITLITGTPGAGKSLLAVKMLVDDILPKAKAEGRRVYCNITDFQAPGFDVVDCGPEGPKEWTEYPDGSICVFDEIQQQYPFKNGASQTPAYIRAYEKHRHRGFDFIFITQGPYLLDRHLHPLIDRHLHVYRPFGFKRSTILEWNGVNEKPQPLQSRTNAAVKNFTFPKRLFKYYKSATQHTVKMRFPWKLAGMFVGLALLLAWAGKMGWDASNSSMFSDPSEVVAGAAEANGGEAGVICATVTAATSRAVHLTVAGAKFQMRPEAVSVAGGIVTVGGDAALAFPLCRVTG